MRVRNVLIILKFMSALDKIMYTLVVEDVLGGLFISVPPGYVACIYDMGRGVLKKVLTPGLHLKIPFWQKAKLFNIQTLEYNICHDFDVTNIRGLGDVPLKAVTLDRNEIVVEGTCLIRLDVKMVPLIWQNIGEDFVAKIVRPTIRSRVKMISSRYTFNDLTSVLRDQIEKDITDELGRIFQPRGIIVENFLLHEIQRISIGDTVAKTTE